MANRKPLDPATRRHFLATAAAAATAAACGGHQNQPMADMAGTVKVPDMTDTCGYGEAFEVPLADQLMVGQYLFAGTEPNTESIIIRDAQGFYALNRHCTHAGCLVQLNSGARTWDCNLPNCSHGSRYAFDGTNIQGPTQEPLIHRAMCRLKHGVLSVSKYQYFMGYSNRVK